MPFQETEISGAKNKNNLSNCIKKSRMKIIKRIKKVIVTKVILVNLEGIEYHNECEMNIGSFLIKIL